MAVKKWIEGYHGIFFITFTCTRWLPLFDISNGYNAVYDWFDSLKRNGHFILGYVIMPNHVHALIAFRHTRGESINRLIGTGKRFMAYAIVKRLEDGGRFDLLNELNQMVKFHEKRKGKRHEIFEPSFDWKECSSEKFIQQKLDYIHANPCSGKWNLSDEPQGYVHSSARFYFENIQGRYAVTPYDALQDIDLTKAS